jgi:hypothetical protein
MQQVIKGEKSFCQYRLQMTLLHVNGPMRHTRFLFNLEKLRVLLYHTLLALRLLTEVDDSAEEEQVCALRGGEPYTKRPRPERRLHV